MESTNSNKGLNLALWVVQALLALILIWAAYIKLLQPIEQVAKMLPWAKDHTGLLTLTGILEFLAALGLILPSALRIQPKLTIITSYGIILLMISAALFHILRNEVSLIGMNIFFLLLAIFVTWGRSKKAVIIPRS